MGLSTTYTKVETDFLIQQLEEKASDKYNDESNSIADDIIKFIDINTGENVNYRETTKWHDGSVMDDSKVDGVIFIKKGSKYYLRQYDGSINIKWFGAKGDGVTDDTLNIQNAFDIIGRIFPPIDLSSGIYFSGAKIFFPNGKYLISETLILRAGLFLDFESLNGCNIHCINHKTAITNVMGSNNGDIECAYPFKINNLTLTQGGLELQKAWFSEVSNVIIMNLAGGVEEETLTPRDSRIGLTIRQNTGLRLNNIKIIGSSGTGVLFEDTMGSGPSTTLYVNELWVSHCQTGIDINGNFGGSHGVITSNFYNIISEYNGLGLKLRGHTDSLIFEGLHFEQNTKDVEAYDKTSFSLKNLWSDLGDITFFASGNGTIDNKVYLENVQSPVIIQNGYKGTIKSGGFVNFQSFPNGGEKVYIDGGFICNDSTKPTEVPAGFKIYNLSKSRPEWFDGGSWRTAEGNLAIADKIGVTGNRPLYKDLGFMYFDTTLNKPIWWDGANWKDAVGNVV